jgi:hypothetical protein
MGKVFTLLTAVLLLIIGAQAAPPTTSSRDFAVYNPDGDRLSYSFTTPSTGGGANRIIIIKAGTPLDFSDPANLPVNGIDYTHNVVYGTEGSEFKSTGGYVIYDGGGGSGLTISNLTPGTTYHFAVFEYNGTGTNTEYRMVPCIGSGTTLSAPTVPTGGISFSSISGTRATISWSQGNGSKTVVVARKGSAPVVQPADYNGYFGASANFGAIGSEIATNANEFVVHNSGANSFTITNLEPNTIYHFAFYEANGSNRPVHLKPGTVASFTTNAGPTTKPGNPNYSAREGDRFRLDFTLSNASKYLVVGRQGAVAPTFIPTNGNAPYTGSLAFGSGTQVAPGEYVISSSNNSSFEVTNLAPNSSYSFTVYGYDTDANGINYYQTGTGLIGVSTGSTVSTPPNQSSITGHTVLSGTSLRLSFNQATGSTANLIIAKAGGPVDVNPEDLIKYAANSSFGSPSSRVGPVSSTNYAVYSTFSYTNYDITNLTPGVTYHFAIFSYNGPNYPVYKTPGNTYSVTMPNEPAEASKNMTFSSIEGNAFQVNWTKGTGSNRIVIAKKGSAVTARPVDGTVYAHDPSFGNGFQIATDEFVVYNGSNSFVPITNLDPNSEYHFAVFEYNTTGAGPDYRTSTFLQDKSPTSATPTIQVDNINITGIQNDRATISFAIGNGGGRLFVMKAGSPVTNIPTNLIKYTDISVFGSGSTIGTGEYVVHKTLFNSNFTVTGLIPGTTYYIAAFEFNGNNAPIYLTPGKTASFVSAGAPPNASTNLQFSNIEGNSMRLNWTSGAGTGSNRIVIAKAGSAPVGVPVSGSAYMHNTAFGSNAFTGNGASSGEYVVYNGNATSTTITGLTKNTQYYFIIYEYNGTGTNTAYLTSSTLSAFNSTVSAPNSISTNASITFPTTTSMRLRWDNGAGANRLVILKQNSEINYVPADYSRHTANTAFGLGSNVEAGAYVVYTASGNEVTITGLTEGATYHYSVFDYNGSINGAPVYTTNALKGNIVFNPLPLTWLAFTGKKTTQGIELKWSTTEEVNTSHFNVERSSNARDYAIIKTIAAKGHASENEYSFTDTNLEGALYYRVKQVDKDGRSSYSKIVSFKADDAKNKIVLYPNPATNKVYIKINGRSIIRLFDAKGSLVKTYQLLQADYIDIQPLLAGIYILEITNQNGVYKTQLVKQ